MRHPRFAALAALLLLAAPLAGCPTTGGTASRELSAAQFDDVPVPAGFVLDTREGRSFSYAEGGGGPSSIRMGRLEYEGLGELAKVREWYAAEMERPIHGWKPAGASGEGLLFTRGADRCLVTCTSQGAAVRVVVERNTGRAAGGP
jgi:hypothetical protein